MRKPLFSIGNIYYEPGQKDKGCEIMAIGTEYKPEPYTGKKKMEMIARVRNDSK